MNNRLREQANYAAIILNSVFMRGPSAWDFTGNHPIETSVRINGKYLDSNELGNFATQAKRNGQYDAAIGAYSNIFVAYTNLGERIPVMHARGFFKVLVSANFFQLAFSLVCTVYADMEKSSRVNVYEGELFRYYFRGLRAIAIEAIDNDDMTCVREFAKNYSGQSYYKLCRSETEIIKDLQTIREQVSKIYGM